jgi:RNA polymerase sigma-70 factor (ECF subfamily)
MAESRAFRPRGPCKPEDPDAELVSRVLAGDAEAFAGLRERYYDVLMKLAIDKLDDRTAAEETVEEAFEDAHNGLPRFKGKASFFTWLWGICWRKICDRLRVIVRDKAVQPIEETLDTEAAPGLYGVPPEPAYRERQKWLRIVAAMQKLPPGQARIMTLRFLVKLSVAEVAQVLEMTERAVEQAIWRGQTGLKELLGMRSQGA